MTELKSSNQDLPESTRGPLKALERERMLNRLLEQRNAAWAANERLIETIEQLREENTRLTALLDGKTFVTADETEPGT